MAMRPMFALSVAILWASPALAVSAEAPATAKPVRVSGPGIHGRAGVRYLSVRDRTRSENDYSMPALDLRLDGHSLGGAVATLLTELIARNDDVADPLALVTFGSPKVGDKDFFTWKADWSKISLHPAYAVQNKDTLFLAVGQSTYQITKLVITSPKN